MKLLPAGLTFTTALLAAACSGSADAPRPIAPSSVDDPGGSGVQGILRDDDGDGIDNEHDRCPLSADDSRDPRRDGCPGSPDAGVPGPL